MKVSWIVLSLGVAIAGGALAQTPPPTATSGARADANSKLVNVPSAAWTVYGPGQTNRYDDKGGPQGYPVTHVVVSAAGKNSWDAAGIASITKPLMAGDVVFVAVYLRAPQLADGETLTLPFVGVSASGPPYDSVATGSVTISNQWKQYYVAGKAPRDFAVGGVQASVHLAGARQTIDLGPIRVFDFGPDADMSRLPHN